MNPVSPENCLLILESVGGSCLYHLLWGQCFPNASLFSSTFVTVNSTIMKNCLFSSAYLFVYLILFTSMEHAYLFYSMG